MLNLWAKEQDVEKMVETTGITGHAFHTTAKENVVPNAMLTLCLQSSMHNAYLIYSNLH